MAMSTPVKILLGIAAGFALVIGALVAIGGYWFHQHKQELLEGGKEARRAGLAFGQGKPAGACLDETFQRMQQEPGLLKESALRIFLKACLESAEPSATLCSGVPEPDEILASASWSLEACAKRGLANDQPCTRMVRSIQEHCHKR